MRSHVQSLMHQIEQPRVFYAILVLLHVLFFAWNYVHETDLRGDDPADYRFAATNIAEHGELYCWDYSEPKQVWLYTLRPPLYPLFLLSTKYIYNSDKMVKAAQGILGFFTIVFVVKIAGLFTRRVRYFKLLLLVLLYPVHFIFCNQIMSDTLLEFLLITAVFCFIKYDLIRRPLWLSLYIVLLIASMLTKPVMYLFVIPNLIFMGVLYRKHRRWQLIVAALLPIAFVYGFSAWNESRTGYFEFSSSSTINALMFHARDPLRAKHGSDSANAIINEIRSECGKLPTYAEEQACIRKRAFGIIRNHPTLFMLMTLRGVMKTLLDPGVHDVQLYFALAKPRPELLGSFIEGGVYGFLQRLMKEYPPMLFITAMVILLGNILKLLSLTRFTKNKSIPTIHRGFILTIVGYLVLLTGTMGEARFALPIFPLLLVMVVSANGKE